MTNNVECLKKKDFNAQAVKQSVEQKEINNHYTRIQ